MIKKNNLIDIEYLKHGIIGAIMFMTAYHFSVNNKSTLTALVPAIPILGLYGLYLSIINKNNVNNYLQKISIFVAIALIFYLVILIIYKKFNNILLAISCGFLIWLICGCVFIDNN